MIVFQKEDAKYRGWSRALEARGIATRAVRGSPQRAPLVLLRHLLVGTRVDAYVFRYLNDYPSTIKTVVRLLSELAVIALLRLSGGRAFWIAHNVDQESSSHHASISRLRRRIVSRAAESVFVMDPLLVSAAQQHIPHARAVDWLCFGAPETSSADSATERVRSAARELRRRLQLGNPNKEIHVGLCVSAASTKCVHFLSVCTFLDSCAAAGLIVGVVVVGAVGEIRDARFAEALCHLRVHRGIVLINEAIQVQENHLVEEIDFFYRALDDLSVSYSLYVAASVRKPMIVESNTFLAEMVRHYGMGVVVNHDQALSFASLHEQMRKWDPDASDRFLVERNWDVAADQIVKVLAASGAISVSNRAADTLDDSTWSDGHANRPRH